MSPDAGPHGASISLSFCAALNGCLFCLGFSENVEGALVRAEDKISSSVFFTSEGADVDCGARTFWSEGFFGHIIRTLLIDLHCGIKGNGS